MFGSHARSSGGIGANHDPRIERRRILVIGQFYADAFALHVAETFEAMGHMAMRFEVGGHQRPRRNRLFYRLTQARQALRSLSDGVPALRSMRVRRLRVSVEKVVPDLIVVCHDKFLWPEEVRTLKGLTSAPIALWFPDSIAGFGPSYFMAAPYDTLFFKDPYIVHVLRRTIDTPLYYLPECFNPHRHRMQDPIPAGPAARQIDIATAGNLHAYRVAFFKQLADYDVRIWGNPPPLWLDLGTVRAMYTGRYVADHEKAAAFHAGRVVVNNLLPSEIWGVNARTFEVAGIGGFQLVDWRPGLAQLFEDGRELVSFRNMADLKRKLDYYLDHEEERLSIARAGMKRAYGTHTYEHRLSLLLNTLFGGETGFPLPDLVPSAYEAHETVNL